ncbi:MAG: hypothetical protein AABX73_03355 [Nanoarchaeota archaeon]
MEKLSVVLVIEILGRPPEHVKEGLDILIERLGSEKGVKLLNKNCHEPVQIQDSKDLFTAFAEIELELDSLENYFGILFAYMPSHIEIIHPEKIALANTELNTLGNLLVQRLHDYDAITKKALIEKDVLLKKLQEISPELFSSNQDSKDIKKTKRKKKLR